MRARREQDIAICKIKTSATDMFPNKRHIFNADNFVVIGLSIFLNENAIGTRGHVRAS